MIYLQNGENTIEIFKSTAEMPIECVLKLKSTGRNSEYEFDVTDETPEMSNFKFVFTISDLPDGEYEYRLVEKIPEPEPEDPEVEGGEVNEEEITEEPEPEPEPEEVVLATGMAVCGSYVRDYTQYEKENIIIEYGK